MIDVNVVTINDKEYIIFEAMVLDDNKYLFLINENDENDMFIRKIIKKDDKEYLVKLDSEEEFNKVMKKFNKKERE